MLKKLLFLLLVFSSIIPLHSQNTVAPLKANLIDGDKFNLYDELAGGRSVLLDFWWIECFDCAYWIPFMEQLYQDYNQNQEELYVLGLNVIKSPTNDNASLKQFKIDNNLHYPGAGWENNTANGDNKFYAWWYYNIKPITNSGGFGQAVLIIPDAGNSADSEVKWFAFGKMQTKEYNDVKDALSQANARQIWENMKPVGFSNYEKTPDVKVFPNPANNYINLVIEEEMGQVRVEIFDMTGRLHLSDEYSGDGMFNLDISSLKAALYNVVISTPNQRSSKIIQVF